MPVYEYRCCSCAEEFEVLILRAEVPSCPSCQSEDLDRTLSLPQVQSSTTKRKALDSAKKRDAKRAADRVQAQAEYTASHDD